MEITFWQQRWADNKIGFHLDSVNPALLDCWKQVAPPAPARIFLPLAGKSLDMCWLANQGYEVVAVEISQLAVESFFREHDLTPTVDEQDGLQFWQAGPVTLICGDYFRLEPHHLRHGDKAAIELVYDRASYIAMPESLRNLYCDQLDRLCPNIPRMLVTLEYDQSQMAGPPFAVDEKEVIDSYGATGYLIETLKRNDVLLDHEHFIAKGMTQLNERVYHLRPIAGENHDK